MRRVGRIFADADFLTLPLPNPLSPAPTSFLRRLIQTRRRLSELKRWHPKCADESASTADRPTVSVMLITFNHERYVAQALDSILMQRRDFVIEINVIDDASTDGTQAIVRDYVRKHPGLINCYFNAKNVGHIATQLNTIRGFQTLRGKYFALLEGDDYWTDENKLALQVAFLDANTSFVACAHPTFKVFDDGSRPPEHFLPFRTFARSHATMYDLISMAGVFHLSSILYRNVFGQAPPPALADPYSCEVTINMTYGLFGDFFCLDRYMSAYRVHDQGSFSGRSAEDIWLFHIHGFRRFAMYLGPRYWGMFSRAIVGFSRYVLSSPKRGDVPRLAPKTRATFWLHLAAAAPFFVATMTSRFFFRASRAVKRRVKKVLSRPLIGDPRRVPLVIYRIIVVVTPVPLIRALLSTEARFPVLRKARHRLRRFLEGA